MSEQRLAKIETLLENIDKKLEDTEKQHSELRRSIYGDGNGFKGMLVRMDRLEQSSAARTWRERAFLTVVIGLVLRELHSLL